MKPSRPLLDWNVWFSVISVHFLAPSWLISLRSTQLPTGGSDDARLFAYPDLFRAGTSLFLHDSGGYIYLGKIHRIIQPSPQPNEKLETVTITRSEGPGKDKLKIAHLANNYQLKVKRDLLLKYV